MKLKLTDQKHPKYSFEIELTRIDGELQMIITAVTNNVTGETKEMHEVIRPAPTE